MTITFRPLERTDFSLLAEWLARAHVREWWGSPTTMEEIEEEYGPSLLPESRDRCYIAQLDGEPIGYIQSYSVVGAHQPEWWPGETDPGARGIDQFLANAGQLGQGLGTAMVRAFVEKLFEDPAVTKVQTDPSPENARAIRCYEKAGFRRVGIVDTPDGPAMLLEQRRTV